MVDVLLHLFHLGMWEEFEEYFKNFGIDFRLFVNLTNNYPPEELDAISKRITDFKPGSTIIVNENRGRDIGGYLLLINEWLRLNEKGKYLVLAHCKSMPWRRQLLDTAFGKGPQIFEVFEKHKEIGMAGSASLNLPYHNHMTFNSNAKNMYHYMAETGLKNTFFSFIAGTIFWVRASIFEDFFTRFHPASLFNRMPFGVFHEPSLAHTFERLFGLIASQNHLVVGIQDNGSCFDERFYLNKNVDVREAVIRKAYNNGWYHYRDFGCKEGRMPYDFLAPFSKVFDEDYYLNKYEDVRNAVNAGHMRSAWYHWDAHGRFEGREPLEIKHADTQTVL